jgi:hypothetical protein
MYHITHRADEPLGSCTYLGRDKTTSRCQTPPPIWIIRGNQPVIPSVPYSMRIGIPFYLKFGPYGQPRINTLVFTEITAQLVCFTVKHYLWP